MSEPQLVPSRYNIITTDPRDKRPVIFNGVTGEVLHVQPRVVVAMESGKTTLLLASERAELAQRGMLVADPDDQLAELEQRFYRITHPEDSPLRFIIWPTTACNLACPYCYEATMTPSRTTMTDEIEDRVVAFIAGAAERTQREQIVLKFYGGEPLLFFDRCRSIARRVEASLGESSERLVSIIQTNGTLIDDETFRRPFPGLAWVELTLDGPRRLHDTIRVGAKREPTFDRITDSVSLLGRSGVPVVLRVNVNSVEEMSEAQRDMEERGLLEVPNLLFYESRANESFVPHLCGSHGGTDFYKEKAEYDLSLRSFLAKSSWAHKYRRFPIFNRFIGVCPFAAVDSVYAIDPRGDLYGCLYQQGVEDFKIGTIAEGGEAKLNFAHEAIISRSPFDHQKCRECPALPRCWGGCLARSLLQEGSFSKPFCDSGKKTEVLKHEIAAGLALGDL